MSETALFQAVVSTNSASNIQYYKINDDIEIDATNSDLEIVVDPGNPVPINKTRLAETFRLSSRYFVGNMDICRGSHF